MSNNPGIDRRQFLTGATGAVLLAMLDAESVRAETPTAPAPGAPVTCAVIGLGVQGRSLLQSLARMPDAPVAIVCDDYEGAHKRALDIAPKARAVSDYRRALENPAVDAVFIATPTHRHRQIALDAVSAGKHVYCEAPLAHTLEDARAIAQAGKDSKKVFQGGLLHRTDPISLQVIKFVDADALGRVVQARGQWHKRTSWRRTAPTPEREAALNWRLEEDISPGLMGEQGIHTVDIASWYLGANPVSITGSGAVLGWTDGRKVPDTVACTFEYPNGVRLVYDATLANSFGGWHEVFLGTDSAIYIKDGLAWMVKEADASALGWEVYARKEKVGDQVGIALVADATKQLELDLEPGKQPAASSVSEQGMMDNIVKGFLNTIRDDEEAAGAGPEESYRATAIALKANDAVKNGATIDCRKEWFDL